MCFPYAGAGASVFASWHKWLPRNVEVSGVQLPGRQSRISERAFTRLPALLSELGPALLPLFDKPFLFFGHSMGAILSFELARWLARRRCATPRSLIVSACRAPQCPASDRFHLLDDSDFLNELGKLNGIPQEILRDGDLLQLVLPALRADVELSETYEYIRGAALPCRITALSGADDDKASKATMDEWRLQTTGEFVSCVLEGGHFFIHSTERPLLDIVRQEMLRTQRLIPARSQ